MAKKSKPAKAAKEKAPKKAPLVKKKAEPASSKPAKPTKPNANENTPKVGKAAKAEVKAEAKAKKKGEESSKAAAPALPLPVDPGGARRLVLRHTKPAKPAKPEKPAKKSKRITIAPRLTSTGEEFVPGEVLIPGGFQSREEVQYLFRGSIACVRECIDIATAEVKAKSPQMKPALSDRELTSIANTTTDRFRGAIEAAVPNRVVESKRTYASVIDRARTRRREICSFLRGLDLGKTEPSHLDTHSEASLQGLMEWAARLEKLTDSKEIQKPDYTQFHRVLDQLDNATELLVIDVELTLRRYKDRIAIEG